MGTFIDPTRISLSRTCEVKYWVDRLGTDAPRLREAVSQAGSNPEVVERLLHGPRPDAWTPRGLLARMSGGRRGTGFAG